MAAHGKTRYIRSSLKCANWISYVVYAPLLSSHKRFLPLLIASGTLLLEGFKMLENIDNFE